MMTIRPGDLVQVDPDSSFKMYRSCPVFVELIDEAEEIVHGYIIAPCQKDNRFQNDTELIKVELPLEDVEYLITPKWAPDICLKNRQRI